MNPLEITFQEESSGCIFCISCLVPLPLLFFFSSFFNLVSHLSVYLAVTQQALGAGPADGDTHSLPRQFYTFSFIWCPLFDTSHLSCCLLLLLLLLLLSTVCAFTQIQERVKERTFSALHIDGQSWDLWRSGLIWWNSLHIVQSGSCLKRMFTCCCILLFCFTLQFKLYPLVRLVHLQKRKQRFYCWNRY